MGTVTLTTEEYDALKNQYHILTPCEVKAEIEKTLYFGQNIAEWRDRAIIAENRLASAGMTPSWNGHECAILKQDAALGRHVRRMPTDAHLRHCADNLWEVRIVKEQSANIECASNLPELALEKAGVQP